MKNTKQNYTTYGYSRKTNETTVQTPEGKYTH